MKCRNVLIILIVILFAGNLLSQTSTPPSSGDGSESNPYQIETLDNLYWLTQNSSSWDKYFIQTADIDATAGGISPIGNSTTKFTGSYNGQGSLISNLIINQSGTDHVGLFGYVENGVIKNLGVTDANITGNDYVGTLAGKTSGSSTVIDMCFTSGSVTGNNFVGGLVGYNLLGATIQNCGSRAAVTGEEYIGGLAGANLETITNCYATGLVTATTGGGGLVDGNVTVNNSFWDTETTGFSGSEGGTGKTSTELKDIATFTNTATSGLTTAWDFVGTTNDDAGTDDWWNMNLISTKTDNDGYPVPSWWVVTDEPTGDGSSGTPYQIATLNNLYWLSEGGGTAIWEDNKYFEQPADIAAKSTAYINTGQGFTPVGHNSTKFNGSYDGQNHAIDYLFINRPGQIRVGLFGYIYNGGDLSNLGITNVDVNGYDETAMLVGDLYAESTAMEITNCYASGSVAGDDFVGGLIGQFRLGNLTITSCHVSGSVEGGLYNVGGMIGGIWNGNQTLENSYSTVDVTAEGTQGGLIGRIYNSGGEVVTISSCYSSGDITISKDGEFTSYAGGLVGLIAKAGASSKIENCYSRGDITDNATSNSGDIGGLIGETSSYSNISINNCYSTGAVPTGGTGNTGGLIGNLLAGSGTACFWDTETSGTTVGVGNTSDPTWVTGETTANMQTQSTFTNAGWDFTNIWAMDGSTNDGYAYLQMLGVPLVTTAEVTNIGTNSAQSGGNVILEGNSPVTAKGVVWNTTGNPTITSNLGITDEGGGTGSFTSNLTGLSEYTLYYVRAYATNSEGTGYGEEKSFTTHMTPPGYALDFDGTNDYVSIANESNFDFTTAMTVEAWIKVDTFDKEWQAMVTKGDNTWRLHRAASTNHISFGTDGVNITDLEGSTDVNDGQWHHIAGVFDGSNKYLYVDGNLDAFANVTGTIDTDNALVNIAENSQSIDRYFDGRIDEVRIWNIARSGANISANMDTVLTGNESGLVAYYKFDQTSGTELYDHTGNDNLGTLQNMDDSDWVASGWGESLAAPQNLSISQSGNDITLSWDAVAGTNRYNVYVASTSDAEFPSEWTLEAANINNTTWTDENVTDDKKFYCVTAGSSRRVIGFAGWDKVK